MIDYSTQRRALRLRESESEKLNRKIDACYNEELDLWNTAKLEELERERIFIEIFNRKL